MLSCLYLASLQGIILGIIGEEKRIARKNNFKSIIMFIPSASLQTFASFCLNKAQGILLNGQLLNLAPFQYSPH